MGSPVSSSVFRLERMAGQPEVTPSSIFEPGSSSPWVTVKRTAPNTDSISYITRDGASLRCASSFLPEDASLLTRVRVALRAMEAIRDDEGDPVYGQLINACLDGNVYIALAEQLLRREEGRRSASQQF